MLKFIVIFIAFLACTYIGFYFGEVYKFRSLELKEFQKAVNLINTEVLFSSTPLPIALLNISYKLETSFSKVFKDIADMLEEGEVFSVYEGFTKSFSKHKDEFNLKEEDLNIIKDFFFSLGESGVYGQEKVFSLTSEELKRKYLEAEEECKVNRKMYRGIGVCVGAIIAIFFI